jgi:hypothetical protein
MTEFEREESANDGATQVEGGLCTVGSEEFYVARYSREGRDRATDAKVLAGARAALAVVTREAAVTIGEFQGLELEGTTASRAQVWLRAFPVGDGLVLAQVSQKEGPLNRASAGAFLQSLTLAVPWSLRAFPEGHFSAWLPEGGIRLGRKQLKMPEAEVAEGVWLGGSEKRAFVVLSTRLDAAEVTAEERIERGEQAMVQDGSRVVWQAPVVVDGAQGRDFFTQTRDSWARLRIVVTNTDLYVLEAEARSKEALLNDDVTRFLSSLRWYSER